MNRSTRIIGIDPGLRNCGWGVIDTRENRLAFVACGVIRPPVRQSLAERLARLHAELRTVLDEHGPDEAAVEETFVNQGARSALQLGQARGVVLMTPAAQGLPVAEYAANLIKKSVVGTGHADKDQVQLMVRTLLPAADFRSADAADALSIAICHAHHRTAPGAKAALAGTRA